MLIHKIGWTLWALIPVAGLAYHFGPGQRPYTEDRVSEVLLHASSLESAAEQAQSTAYQSHLAALAARKQAMATRLPEDVAAVARAAAEEDRAYQVAAEAWKRQADQLTSACDLLTACGSERADAVRIARNRSLIRSGRLAEGLGDLESMLNVLSEAGQESSPLAKAARDEAATGYYYGARLMRAAGKPTEEWREVLAWSRQNFRYLAESATQDERSLELAAGHQKNLELALNLEQSGNEDLLAKPMPRNCPRGSCDNLSSCKGKSKKPPRRKKDARGSGGVGEIDGGW